MLPDIGQMCEAVTSEFMTYTLTTNGSRLRRHLAWLRANPPETLWVSYHAEYYSPAELTRRLGVAATNMPRVGLNVFGTDCLAHPEILDLAVSSGTTRIKILSKTPIGRARELSEHTQVERLIETLRGRWPGGVELRYEAPMARLGSKSCVLSRRPLLSIDRDGRAYPCCVTVGSNVAIIGDLAIEQLARIVLRSVELSNRDLPCSVLLPHIAEGREGCPLNLQTAGAQDSADA
jgi:hypothetical protein